tara:strand:+ start:2185 stop:2598 length:414 start_codon:yes stop_codon:yes gene_type:complete
MTKSLPFPATGEKLHWTKSRKNYEFIILDSIEAGACFEMGCDGATERGKLDYISKRFDSEFSWWPKRHPSKQQAIADWLSGGALGIPLYNYEILNLAKDCGSVAGELTEKQEDQIISNYWDFMAAHILRMMNKELVA